MCINKKKSIRQELLAKRDDVHKKYGVQFSIMIYERFLTLPEITENLHFFIYLHFKSEVETSDIIEYLLEQDKRVSVPVIDTANKAMHAAEIKNLSDVKIGPFGIFEPVEKKIIKSEQIDCVIVPGAVFDRTGGRIGYGGGYYDRFFKRANKKVVKIGLAYSVQLLKSVPQEVHDIPLDVIITEKEKVRVEKSS